MKSDLEKLQAQADRTEKSNQVQDQRLADLERGTTAALEQQAASLEKRVDDQGQRLQQLLDNQQGEVDTLREQLVAQRGEVDTLREQLVAQRGELNTQRQQLAGLNTTQLADNAALNDRLRQVEGSVRLQIEKTQRVVEEQEHQIETLERTQAQIRRVGRRLEEQALSLRAYRAEQEEFSAELQQVLMRQLAAAHATQNRLAAVEMLLQSPIGDIPSKTEADRLYRSAFAMMMEAQLDLAADKFLEFQVTYPDDERVVEALFRQGQCYYLMRKFDHALAPSLELVERYPDHSRADEARWFLARSLEETGDFALARQFYAGMIDNNSLYKPDAMRRVQFINQLLPNAANGGDSR
ncbi:MAG: tetratricopeptide repeat protein [SAR324 cluster bacterium]|nr:tetratricopeptide repeat protein [SAR324 cluster bacterium]